MNAPPRGPRRRLAIVMEDRGAAAAVDGVGRDIGPVATTVVETAPVEPVTRGTTMSDVIDRTAADQQIQSIMTTAIVTVEQHDSVRDAAKELTADEIGAVLVSGPTGPVGIVSERDITTIVAVGGDPAREQVRGVMAVDLVTAAPTDTVAAVGRLMIEANMRHIAIRREDRRIVGIVSIRDVLDAVLG